MENNEKKLRKIDNLSTQSSIERTSMMYDENHCGSCGCGSCGCGSDGCCSCGCCGSHNGSCGCGSEKCCSGMYGSDCSESCGSCGSNNGSSGCSSSGYGTDIWGSCDTSGSSDEDEIDYSLIMGSGYKGSPTGCAESASTGSAPDTWKAAKNPVNVMNNAFVRGRINMMWDEMLAKVKDNPKMEVACCIFYDLDNKEYIGGKFIYGKDGKVEIKDYSASGNGYTGSSEHIKLVTVVHTHFSLTHDKGHNVRHVGPSDDDFKAVSKSKYEFGIVIDYQGKEEDYRRNPKEGETPDGYYEHEDGTRTPYKNDHGIIIRSGHPASDTREYSIINGSGIKYHGEF